MIKWLHTSKLLIQNSLSGVQVVLANREELVTGSRTPLMSLLSRLINAPEEDQTSDAMGQGESPMRPIVLQGFARPD